MMAECTVACGHKAYGTCPAQRPGLRARRNRYNRQRLPGGAAAGAQKKRNRGRLPEDKRGDPSCGRLSPEEPFAGRSHGSQTAVPFYERGLEDENEREAIAGPTAQPVSRFCR